MLAAHTQQRRVRGSPGSPETGDWNGINYMQGGPETGDPYKLCGPWPIIHAMEDQGFAQAEALPTRKAGAKGGLIMVIRVVLVMMAG